MSPRPVRQFIWGYRCQAEAVYQIIRQCYVMSLDKSQRTLLVSVSMKLARTL